MKKLQQFCAAFVLTTVLALSTFAGDMGAPGVANLPPPPPQQFAVTSDVGTPDITATGDISMPGVVALDPVTEAALSLLHSILSFF